MSDETEYIEPTQEHVGQMVEVRDSEEQAWIARKLITILDDQYEFHFVCEDGKLRHLTRSWKYARIPRPLTYAERQAKCGLKVGDRVKFVRAWEQGELGTTIRHYDAIDKCVGTNGRAVDICSEGIKAAFGGTQWWLPYFVLEKVKDRVATQNDCGATVYVDGSPQDEFRIIVLWQEVDTVWRAVVRSGDKRFVYELSNLRVIE